MKRINHWLTFVCLALVMTAFKADHVITIFMIGDSTMANKQIKNGNLERGWGMALQCYFDDAIRVDNHAVNGRSSKSFIDEGRWQKVVDKIRPGDYVFIQFGHNDEKPKADRHTDPGSTFDDNLRRFVRETRAKGGIPVLFNCVVRRNFFKQIPRNDDDEALRKTVGAPVNTKGEEGDTLRDTHGDYRYAPRHVALEEDVVFVDANLITHRLEQRLGREDSKKLHMWFLPGQEPSVPKGRQDNTHYNIYGAHTVAKLLAEEVARQIPALAAHLTHADCAVAKNGIGQYFSPQEAVDHLPVQKATQTVQIFAGEWEKPRVPKDKKIKFVLREGATWKK